MVMTASRFLAIDWGTTNRRVFLIDDNSVVATDRDDRGVTTVADFPGELAKVRERFEDLPVLMAGMVGSNVGWKAVPYVPASAGIEDLACALTWLDARTAIVPGVSTRPADVMRGEEVQLLGAVAAALAPPDALLVQPGTHCKWVDMRGGRIAGFKTTMTGELFALLRSHGLLAAQLGSDVHPNDAFRDGVEEGKKRDLTASLFGVRAAGLLGERRDGDAASFTSGLLIGSDVAARLSDRCGETIHVLADRVLGGLYAAAVEANGCSARLVDSHAGFVAGIVAIEQAIAARERMQA
nr:2-dehydro-3-deoxygalactonokinase [Sphingomonas sp.]